MNINNTLMSTKELIVLEKKKKTKDVQKILFQV